LKRLKSEEMEYCHERSWRDERDFEFGKWLTCDKFSDLCGYLQSI
jgi:hypothetical protein